MRCLPIFLTAAVFVGCGGSDSSTVADSDSDAAGDDDDAVGDDDDDGGTCSTWVNTYDLTGSRFFIDALADFTITLQEPYNGDENMGPGTLTIRFADNGGAAGDGAAHIMDYALTQDFITGNGAATVHTELENDASDECGVGAGTLAGTELTWSPAVMTDHCQNGQISCVGLFCGAGGSPEEGQPEIVTDDCGDQAIGTFTFAADLSTLSVSEATIISEDDNAIVAMSYAGTLISSELDANTPACLCP